MPTHDERPLSPPQDPKEFRRWIRRERWRRAIPRLVPFLGVLVWRLIVGDSWAIYTGLGVVVALVGMWITGRRWKKRKAKPGFLVSSYATFVPQETELHGWVRESERRKLRRTTPVVGWIWLDRHFLRWEPRWRARSRSYRQIKIPVGDITHAWVHTTEDDSGHLRTRLSVKLRDGRSGPFVLHAADEPDVEQALRTLGVDVRG